MKNLNGFRFGDMGWVWYNEGMKYEAGKRRRASEYEKALVRWWKDNRTFERSVEERPEDDAYVFYDGPPFITGMPHHGTLLSSIVKDAVPRFWTMRGKRVERRWGWDCHGLPAENFVEKQLGITDRREIGTKWSLEDYILKARESMVANSETWEGTIDRIGRWVDFKGAYRTMDKDFMESVWWAFKTLYEAGKIYEGRKVLMYDTKFATPVSKSEVTMDNDAYQTVTDPSAYVKFKLRDSFSPAITSSDSPVRSRRMLNTSPLRSSNLPSTSSEITSSNGGDREENVYFLAWTTTPWTLPANMALAVNPEMEYVAVCVKRYLEVKNRRVIEIVKGLGLPLERLIVFGSGLLDVLGIRDMHDIDLIADTEVYEALKNNPEWSAFEKPEGSTAYRTVVDGVEVEVIDQRDWVDWDGKKTEFAGLLANTMNVEGVNFFSLGDLQRGKKIRGLDKDLQDVKSISEYMGSMNEILILAKSRLESVLKGVEYEVVEKGIKGESLIGLTYESICVLPQVASSSATSSLGRPVRGSSTSSTASLRASDSPRTSSKADATQTSSDGRLKNTWSVLGGDFVSDEDGTGIVHIAPAYGEDDYRICQENGVDFVDVLDEYGYYLPEVAEKLHELGVRDTDERGIEIWAGNKFIAKCLEEAGIVWKIEYIKHEYPFNPRSKQRIMYRAFPSWFFDVQGQKELMLEQNENINWFPGYLKHGRFAKNIEQAPDWNLSRDRFWATAMPVWKGDRGTVKVVGSYAELKELSGVELEDYHRPWVDEIRFTAQVKDSFSPAITSSDSPVRSRRMSNTSPLRASNLPSTSSEITSSNGVDIIPYHDGDEVLEGYHLEHFERIDKVLDCWFESGSMPFAQLHYPFENKEKFERNYPADFIVEYVGQVRAWFYYVHTVNTALAEVGAFGEKAQKRAEKNAFKNVITTGTLAGNDGRKMSKSLGNYTDPNVLMDQYSADALRFLLLSSPVLSGEDFALTDKDVSDTQRKLAMIWNVYDFFVTYAEVDGWEGPDSFSERITASKSSSTQSQDQESSSFRASDSPCTSSQITSSGEVGDSAFEALKNPLDRWIVSRLNELKLGVIEGMEEYNIPRALAGVLPFVDDLSNWFVRRSRRRFWKSEDDGDKAEAYWTLYTVLSELAVILAPFVPFLAEELWQNLVGGWDKNKSVHLLNYPTREEAQGRIDQEVLDEMARVRGVINDGLALRMRKSETEEQVKVRQPLSRLVYAGEKLPEWGEEIVKDEVNVKVVEPGEETWIDKEITEELAREGWTRELIRAVQSARKKAGLMVDDRIRLSVGAEVPEEWVDLLKREVLAEELSRDENYAYDEIVKVNGENVTISLERNSS